MLTSEENQKSASALDIITAFFGEFLEESIQILYIISADLWPYGHKS
jgi:hypothetical protein